MWWPKIIGLFWEKQGWISNKSQKNMQAPLGVGLRFIFVFLPPTTVADAALYSVTTYGGLAFFQHVLSVWYAESNQACRSNTNAWNLKIWSHQFHSGNLHRYIKWIYVIWQYCSNWKQQKKVKWLASDFFNASDILLV